MSRRSMFEIMQGVAVRCDAPRPHILANNTIRYVRPDGVVVTRLHDTDIIEVGADGTVTLNSGGWQTVTTKERLNRFAPGVSVWSVAGVWMCGRSLSWGGGRKARAVPFYDGIKFTKGGRCLNPRMSEATRTRRLAKAINKFARQVMDVERWPTLPVPGSGDCWGCSMFDRVEEGAKRKKSSDPSHLLSHIGLGEDAEDYLHGWLIINAMRWAGYRDTGIRSIAFSAHPTRSTVASCLRRYLRFQLGLSI